MLDRSKWWVIASVDMSQGYPSIGNLPAQEIQQSAVATSQQNGCSNHPTNPNDPLPAPTNGNNGVEAV